MGRENLKGAPGDPLRAGEPVPFSRLVGETAGLLRRTWSSAWPAWLGVLVAQFLVYVLAAVVLEPTRPVSTGAAFLLMVAEAAATSLPFAFGLRVALGVARPLAFDRALAIYVGLNTLGAAIIGAWFALGDAIDPEKVKTGVLSALFGGYLIVAVGLTAVFVMLSLWPLGRLARDPGATAARSWREMRGAVLPVMFLIQGVGGALGAMAILAVRGGLPPTVLGDETSLLNLGLTSAAFYPVNLVATVAIAAVWLIRAGDGARRVGEFD